MLALTTRITPRAASIAPVFMAEAIAPIALIARAGYRRILPPRKFDATSRPATRSASVTAARADGMDVDDGSAHGIAVRIAERADSRATIEQRHIRRGAAHVESDQAVAAESSRQRGGADNSGSRSRKDRADRLGARQLGPGGAAVGLHDPELGPGEVSGELFEMRRHPGGDIRVDYRGREAFVLAIFREQPMRDRDRADDRSERPSDCILGAGVRVRMEQANREGLRARSPGHPRDPTDFRARKRRQRRTIV